MDSDFSGERREDDAERRRLDARSKEQGESPGTPPGDDMLVVDESGTIVPFHQGPAKDWKIPQSGKTLPLNQRFGRMWQVPSGVLDRLALETQLRHALDREEFIVHFQPQADVRTGRIVGMEALVRWRHSERGIMLPDEFIPLAEETGLIVQLGEWVLRKACEQNRALHDAGLRPLRVAVNLSARQFQQENLVDMVSRALDEAHLDPGFLELEITEGTALQNVEHAAGVVRKLWDRGIQTSMDDFGRAYSSLGYLKDLPVRALKIDRSLISGVTTEPNHAAVSAAIITMASSLNLEVVAEGVETEGQLAFLREQRCDKYQGFLLGKAMPSESIGEMLGREERRDAA